MKDLSYSLLFDYYGGCFGEKQRKIFESYYNDDLSLSEIAENVGMTRQGVSDFIKRTEQQLCDFEKVLGLASKFGRLKELAQNVRNGSDIRVLTDYISEL